MLEFKKSTRQGKKYMVYYTDRLNRSKWIHFGDITMGHFKDSTPLELYSHLDHNDPIRRRSYLARAEGIRNKKNELVYLDKTSPAYYSYHFLWL